MDAKIVKVVTQEKSLPPSDCSYSFYNLKSIEMLRGLFIPPDTCSLQTGIDSRLNAQNHECGWSARFPGSTQFDLWCTEHLKGKPEVLLRGFLGSQVAAGCIGST